MNSIEADRERRARREGKAEGLREGRAEGLREGKAEGMREAKIEVASRMLANGMSEDQVREITGLTEEQIDEARRLLRIP